MNNAQNSGAAALALAVLREQGVSCPADTETRMIRFFELVREWNPYAGLVSKPDLDRLHMHAADSLSLCPYVLEAAGESGSLLDIGSGGGFPAIPIKMALPNLHVTLVDRSERRVGFLVKVLGELALNNVIVWHAEYPRLPRPVSPHVITARAVDQADRVTAHILARLSVGGVYLCQRALNKPLDPKMFHVKPIVDRWTELGLRRGILLRITIPPA